MEVFDGFCVYQKWEDQWRDFKATYEKTETDVTVGETVEVFMKYLTQEEVDGLKEKEDSFSLLTLKCAEMTSELENLRQFKADFEAQEAKEKADMELKDKTDIMNKFEAKLSKDEISSVIDNVDNFSVDEIKTKLSVVLANKLLSEDANFEASKIVNIDNANKLESREERLIAELKSKRK